MDPLTTVTSALASIKAAIDIAKILKNADISLEKAEFKLKLADLVAELADAKLQIVNIQDVISEKDSTIKDLKQKLELENKMQFQTPFYWRIDGKSQDGPFCPQCWDNERKQIRCIDHHNGVWTCPTCKNTYRDNTFNR